MNIYKFLLSSILFAVVCSLSVQAKGPNLIIILTDDQGYADVGFNGSTDILTPHIDTIAASGVRFTPSPSFTKTWTARPRKSLWSWP